VNTTAVPGGPAAYRRSLRTLGPLAALVPPLVTGLLAMVLLNAWPCEGRACVAPGAAGTLLGGLAVPTAPIVGLPWRSGTPVVLLSLVSSVAVWLFLGSWAARRATRSPVADWKDWRREFRPMLLAVWAGFLVGLGLMGAVVLYAG
jgi:hypothetical protein